GLPFVLLGWFTGLASALPRSGAWTEMTKRVFGVLMLGSAVYFLGQALSRGVAGALLAGYFLAAGGFLLAGEHGLAAYRGVRTFKSVFGALLAAAGVYLLVGVGGEVGRSGPAQVVWQGVTQEALTQAQQAGQPIVLDFGATWCQKCEELEQRTFSDPGV